MISFYLRPECQGRIYIGVILKYGTPLKEFVRENTNLSGILDVLNGKDNEEYRIKDNILQLKENNLWFNKVIFSSNKDKEYFKYKIEETVKKLPLIFNHSDENGYYILVEKPE